VVADVRGLQEMATRALPADYVEYVGDWWLRYSPGSSWSVRTALPHGTASEDELRKRIFAAERFYDRLGSVTRFQVTPGACPDRLDSMLAENGYRQESLVSLRTASTAEVQRIRRGNEFSLRWDPNPTPEWFGSGTRSTTMAVTRLYPDHRPPGAWEPPGRCTELPTSSKGKRARWSLTTSGVRDPKGLSHRANSRRTTAERAEG
jgi:hypothetical protein